MTENRPDLSIVIVSFNTRDLTRECLRSIFENTKGIALEVFVVDNASSDESAEMVETEFADVKLIRNDVNKGLAAATNDGLNPSLGRYVMALNSDTVISSGALARLVGFMDDHPEAGGTTPKLTLPDGGLHPQFFGDVETLGKVIKEAISPLSSEKQDKPVESIDLETTREIPCVHWGTAFIVRRETFENVGGQDPRFFVYAEDIDWSMRITKAGWKLFYVADAEIVHYGGESTKQASVKMQAQLWKSKCRLIQKHYGLPAGLVLRLAVASVSFIRLIKWLPLYAFKPSSREKSMLRIDQMWAIMRAALTY